MTKPPIIQLKSISKSYRRGKFKIPVLSKLDLDFHAGDLTAIMGPSGSGKTTLLNIVGGIDQVDGGEILFKGNDIANMSDQQAAQWRARNVGFIFQFYNLMPGLTAAQNVELPLTLTKLSRTQRKARVHAMLGLVGLEDRTDHRPNQLSGGQQQRVAIARALVGDPEVLLADEPTGDLDRETADHILDLLQLLCVSMNKTVIMVTHDQSAADMATRTLNLDKGRLVTSTNVTDKGGVA